MVLHISNYFLPWESQSNFPPVILLSFELDYLFCSYVDFPLEGYLQLNLLSREKKCLATSWKMEKDAPLP